MSLTVYLENAQKTICECICDKCDLVHEHSYHETLYSDNITHNLAKMANACGIFDCLWMPEENGITIAEQLIPLLEKGLDKLITNPDEYKKYNSPNGWGVYEHFVRFVSEYLEACKEHPNAKVKACR